MEMTLPPELEVFKKDLGTWNGDIEIHAGPNGVQRSKGKLVGRMLGGRWLLLDFRNETGFEGHGIYSYDPETRSYVGTWVDSMRSFIAVGRGEWNAATRTMTYHYHRSGTQLMQWREESTLNADGTQSFRVIMTGPGGDMVMMKAHYHKAE
jgi:hypothetical protein